MKDNLANLQGYELLVGGFQSWQFLHTISKIMLTRSNANIVGELEKLQKYAYVIP